MSIHNRKNYAFQDPECENGDEFHNCNIIQKQPNTEICAGKTGLRFVDCNLINCKLPSDAVFEGHPIIVQKSFCYHLHPRWNLPTEPEDCPHVVDADEVTIDGQVVGIIYHRKDTRLN